jgi:hypothetical protein
MTESRDGYYKQLKELIQRMESRNGRKSKYDNSRSTRVDKRKTTEW